MSRPESQQSLGYFPCPLEVIDRICESIQPHPEMVVCDPCAGTGRAIEHLAQQLGVARERVIAAELDIHRSAALAERLPESRVTSCVDFLSAIYYGNSVSLMYLNPPYDNELGYSQRMESTFLSRATNAIIPGGILVYVVPRSRVRVGGLRQMLHNLYEQVESFDFPSQLRKYDECVVIAYKRRKPTSDSFTHFSFLKSPNQVSVDEAKAGAPFTFRKQQYAESAKGGKMLVAMVAAPSMVAKGIAAMMRGESDFTVHVTDFGVGKRFEEGYRVAISRLPGYSVSVRDRQS